MHLLRTLRWSLLALLLSLVSISANAGVFISVGIAPPPLPVYEQPPCPEPGLMWTPGYWAYGDDGYYWVPGAWVPAPQPGYLWTPPYWGWENGMYLFHRGYWGPHVGYYGGVNYGFGYGGIGFVGGEWRGGHFAYNTAVMHLGFHGGMTFFDRGRVDRGYVVRDSHVAFSGGPGGIHHDRGPDEWRAEREHHMDVTSFQHSHEDAARGDRGSYFRSNNGRPARMAVDRPLGSEMHGPAQPQHDFHQPPQHDFHQNDRGNPDHGNWNGQGRPQSPHDNWQAPQSRPQYTQQPHQDYRNGGNPPHDFHSNGGPAPQNQPPQQFHPNPQQHQEFQQQHAPAQQFHPVQQPHQEIQQQHGPPQQFHPSQQPRPTPQQNAAPAQHSAPPQHTDAPRDKRGDEHRQHR